jgi:sulfoxide reductase heme-binding subunit YedZ
MTNLTPHLFWITSRAAGFAALILASLAVSLGLLMSTKLLRRRRSDLISFHEILSLSTIVAIVVHAVTLLGDAYLHPSAADISVPFVSSYKTVWMSIGIIGGWSLVLLGLSYYFRARIGAARWRKLHRFTAVAWLAGLVHSLGMGTDAGQMWFLAMLAMVAIPALGLLAIRLLGSGTANAPVAMPRGTKRRASSKAGRVADHEAGELAAAACPARATFGQRHGVKAPAGDGHPNVAGVRIDRDPAARAGVAPVLKVARDHR